MTSTTSRATAKAGKLQAGDTIAPDQNLPDLLTFDSVEAGTKVGDLLRERLDDTERAVAAHASKFEDAQLAGDEAERAHADEAGRLGREVARLQVAIERADERLAAVAADERKAAARVKLKAAAKAAARAETIVAREYPAAARAVAALIDELRQAQAEVLAARGAAAEAEIFDEVGDALSLPHERRSAPAEFEEVVIENINHGPRVLDAAGNAVTGRGRHFGTPAEATPTVTRRRERRLVRDALRGMDLARADVRLPDPETEHGYIIRQGD